MAHEMKVFKVPIAVEFTASKGNWIPAVAVVLDWWRTELGEVDAEFLKVAIQSGPAAGEVFQMGVNELSEEIFDLCASADGQDDIAERCSGQEPRVLVNILKSPINRIGDAWSMRADFFEMARTEEGVIEFLNKWGTWNSGRIETAARLVAARSNLAAALADQPEKWLRSHASHLAIVSRSKEYPYFLVKTSRCAAAVRIATTVDLLNGLRFRVCARRDCAAPFPIESKHKKKYCKQYCAHLESVRRNRRKKN